MHVPCLVVISGGEIGAGYVRQLLRAVAKGRLTTERIVVVDRDPVCVAAGIAGGDSRICLEVADWAEWLDDNLSSLGRHDQLVPYHWAPHLLAGWLERQAQRRGAIAAPGGGIPPRGVPYERTTRDGGLALSYATWTCPPTCIEPALCPHTRGPKDWSLAAHLAAPRAGDPFDEHIVLPSLHLVFGVATVPVAAIHAARDRVLAGLDAGARRYLVATASHCHGLAQAIEVRPGPPGRRPVPEPLLLHDSEKHDSPGERVQPRAFSRRAGAAERRRSMRSRSNALQAALGFRSHSGWATLVALKGPVESPSVLLRRRIELVKKLPRQPFHAAEGRPFKEAEALIRRSTDEAHTLASRALQQALAELNSGGPASSGCGLLLAAGRPLPALAQILASHALIHAAEGELFRDALRDASQEFGLHLTEVKERELHDRATRTLGLPPAALSQRLAEWGRALGPPWRQDEKFAALVAWLALIRPGGTSS